ncbi:hypothetical protein HYPBUDRAFT_154307 [Hyphopichia burtonii NRRL Y-1933]|uniref:Uncharacterized protein n=1 Tax=Hyphopichia burtonii NRRL Y-1933 TaxID=984485 RepID=A0A1E4RBU0_9ASCO|nr:hypothetical protein HYPBUDRAFT_154307 [Hyphopichia burtonii NRRL Y-1933]ODV64718.1 hypothetical protein HYPBUDRAFT_154307 [Hyphopichia burtonii NRRL Y-1933]
MDFTNTQDIIDGYLRGQQARTKEQPILHSRSTSGKTRADSNNPSPHLKKRQYSGNSMIDDITVFGEEDRDNLMGGLYIDPDIDRLLRIDDLLLDLSRDNSIDLNRGIIESPTDSISIPSPIRFRSREERPEQKSKNKEPFDQDVQRLLSIGKGDVMPNFEELISKDEEEDFDDEKLLEQTHKAIQSLPVSITGNREFEKYEKMLNSAVAKAVKLTEEHRRENLEVVKERDEMRRRNQALQEEILILKQKSEKQQEKLRDNQNRINNMSKVHQEREMIMERERGLMKKRLEETNRNSNENSQLVKENELLREKLIKYKGLYEEQKKTKPTAEAEEKRQEPLKNDAIEKEGMVEELVRKLMDTISNNKKEPVETEIKEEKKTEPGKMKMLEVFEQAFEQLKNEETDPRIETPKEGEQNKMIQLLIGIRDSLDKLLNEKSAPPSSSSVKPVAETSRLKSNRSKDVMVYCQCDKRDLGDETVDSLDFTNESTSTGERPRCETCAIAMEALNRLQRENRRLKRRPRRVGRSRKILSSSTSVGGPQEDEYEDVTEEGRKEGTQTLMGQYRWNNTV